MGYLNELMTINHLAKRLAHGKCSLNGSYYNSYYRINIRSDFFTLVIIVK